MPTHSLLVALALVGFLAEAVALEKPHPAQRWQHAILPLSVPVERRQHQQRRALIEDCSATVIATRPVRLLSAWHCFDGYNDLTKPPLVTTPAGTMALRLIASGGSMLADWALLEAASPTVDASLSKLPSLAVAPLQDMPNAAVMMVGFSHVGGDQHRQLRADMHCKANTLGSHWVRSDCLAYKGASGGPVMQKINNNWRVVGVVSAKDDSGTRLFTPVPRRLLNR